MTNVRPAGYARMSGTPRPIKENRLLAALPVEERERLAPHLEPVSLGQGQILFRRGETIRYVYFPTTAVISLLTDLEDGAGMEVGLVGREGVAGIAVILDGRETKLATVQGEGAALRLRAETLQEEFRKGGALQRLLLRYTHALITQISQSVVCNMRHKLEGRLARWLLMFRDRIDADEFTLTQKFIADLLGVRRSSVSDVANRLQAMGFIRYSRGRITILDRDGLQGFACECYPVVKEEYDNFLS